VIRRRNLARTLRKVVAEPGYAVQAFNRRFRSTMSYKFSRGRSAYPETISLFLTYQCNLRCKMCGQWGEGGSSRGYTPEVLRSRLSVDEIRAVIDDVKSFRPNVTLFGGEPLMYKEWPDVVTCVKEAGLRCNMITNGTLLERNAEKVVELGVDEIIFSLDGPREVHDEMRSAAGTFGKACAGLQAIAALRKSLGRENPRVNISSTIFEVNYRRLGEIVDVAEAIGAASITFHHLIFISVCTYERHCQTFGKRFDVMCSDWAGFMRDQLPDIDVDVLLETVRQLRQRQSSVDISFYPNFTEEEIRRYYTSFEFIPSSYKPRCMSPWMVAYVFPDGTVRPCQSLNFVAGSIREHTFREVWNSERYKEFRRAVKSEGMFPVCSKCTELYRF